MFCTIGASLLPKANIDHIVVCPPGVFLIDAKKYQGQRPSLRIVGGWIRAHTETLIVGSRYGTKLVDGVHKQVDRVRAALERMVSVRCRSAECCALSRPTGR